MGAGYGSTTERTSGYERREQEYEREGTRGAGTAAVPAVALESSSQAVPVVASAGEEASVVREGREEVCGREYFTKVTMRGGCCREAIAYLEGRLLCSCWMIYTCSALKGLDALMPRAGSACPHRWRIAPS